VEVARRRSIDIAIQPDGLGRRSQRLVVLDVDSTLIQHEVIDLLAAEAGCAEQVASITERAMAGELDFEASLRARVALLEGLDEAALARALERMTLTPGAKTFVRTLRRMGFRVAIVSGGFTYFTDHLRRRLHIDHAFANKLEVVDGKLTGRVRGRVVDRRRKAELLERVARKEGIPLDQTVAVGDGANDLDMLARAGLGIAFNAKPVVADAADAALSVPYLDAILFLLGIRQSEVAAADAAGGLVPD
jgi:phosphoserine phosphatase